MLQRKNRSQNSHVRIWILCLILFLSVVAYADRSILSISGSAIKQEFGIKRTTGTSNGNNDSVWHVLARLWQIVFRRS